MRVMAYHFRVGKVGLIQCVYLNTMLSFKQLFEIQLFQIPLNKSLLKRPSNRNKGLFVKENAVPRNL